MNARLIVVTFLLPLFLAGCDDFLPKKFSNFFFPREKSSEALEEMSHTLKEIRDLMKERKK